MPTRCNLSQSAQMNTTHLWHISLQQGTWVKWLPADYILVIFQYKSKVAEILSFCNPILQQLCPYFWRNFWISLSDFWGFGWTVHLDGKRCAIFLMIFITVNCYSITNNVHIITFHLQTDSRRTSSHCSLYTVLHKVFEAIIPNSKRSQVWINLVVSRHCSTKWNCSSETVVNKKSALLK